MTEEKKPTRLEAIEAKRAARRVTSAAASDDQRATDLEAIDALETSLGDSNVSTITVPYTPGLPVVVACRCPKPVEMKRYRDRVKPKKGETQVRNQVEAAEELAAVCRVYPDAEVFAALCEARPGLCVQLGLEALELGSGKADEDLKG